VRHALTCARARPTRGRQKEIACGSGARGKSIAHAALAHAWVPAITDVLAECEARGRNAWRFATDKIESGAWRRASPAEEMAYQALREQNRAAFEQCAAGDAAHDARMAEIWARGRKYAESYRGPNANVVTQQQHAVVEEKDTMLAPA
jgi:hypothetical protein